MGIDAIRLVPPDEPLPDDRGLQHDGRPRDEIAWYVKKVDGGLMLKNGEFAWGGATFGTEPWCAKRHKRRKWAERVVGRLGSGHEIIGVASGEKIDGMGVVTPVKP